MDGIFAADAPLDEHLGDTSLVELVDHLLDTGCVIQGDLVLGLAEVDLIYCQISVLLCSVERLKRMRGET